MLYLHLHLHSYPFNIMSLYITATLLISTPLLLFLHSMLVSSSTSGFLLFLYSVLCSPGAPVLLSSPPSLLPLPSLRSGLVVALPTAVSAALGLSLNRRDCVNLLLLSSIANISTEVRDLSSDPALSGCCPSLAVLLGGTYFWTLV